MIQLVSCTNIALDALNMSNDSPHSTYTESRTFTVKSLLAKLMAKENLTVIQSSKAPTAFMDTKNRVLVLPKWKNMTDEIYSLLVSHEVGHALFTPAEPSLKELIKDKPKYYNDILQIVEDARIEKKIKRRFAGIQKFFRTGYIQMVERGIMKVPDMQEFYENGELTPLSFLDRLLIHTKSANYIDVRVPFLQDEIPLVYGTEETETFDHVLEVSEEILEYLNKHIKESEAQGDSSEEGEDDNDGYSDSPDSSDQKGNGKKDDQENPEPGNGEDNNDDSNENNDKDSNGEPDKLRSSILSELNSKLRENTEASENDYNDNQYSDDLDQDREDGSENNFYNTSDKSIFDDSDKVIFDTTKLSVYPHLVHYTDICIDMVEGVYRKMSKTDREYLEGEFRAFQTRTSKVINHMVQEFQLRKAARMSQRISVSKKGILDTNKLIKYKFSDDLFLSHTTTKKGKSHGVILLLDMSYSMVGCFYHAAMQILNLSMFCERANIPFEVLGFTNNGPVSGLLKEDKLSSYRNNGSGLQLRRDLVLNHYMSSSMNKSELHVAMKTFFLLGLKNDRNKSSGLSFNASFSRLHSLNSTPLDASLLATKDLFWRFKEANNLDIVHCVIVTDGESDVGVLTSNGSLVYNCLLKNGPFSYDYCYGNSSGDLSPVLSDKHAGFQTTTGSILELLKDETGCKVISFFTCQSLDDMYNCREFSMLQRDKQSVARSDFANKGFAEVESYYDKMFIINPSLFHLDNTTGEDKVVNQAKARPLLANFIQTISTDTE